MELHKVVLAATFGRGSVHPFRAALARLAGLWLGSAGLGIVLASGLRGAYPDTGASPHLVFTAAFAMQLAILFALAAALGMGHSGRSDVLARLLLTWPVTPRQRWIALLMPSVVLAILAATLVAPALGAVLMPAGLHPLLFAAGSIAGIGSAFGLVYGLAQRRGWLHFVCIVAALSAEYTLTGHINEQGHVRSAASIGMSALLATLLLLFYRSTGRIAAAVARARQGRDVQGSRLPAWLWFAKKIIRSPVTRLGFASAFAMGAVAAGFGSHYGLDAATCALFASVLAAAFASDMRALCQRRCPAEIVALRGTRWFLLYQTSAAIAWALLAIAPLLWLYATSEPLSIAAGMQVLLGIAVGLFASTLIVPARRDIMAQFLATLLCLGTLTVLPQLLGTNVLQPGKTALFHAGLVALCLTAMYAIERKRNNYVWREHAA